VLEKAGLMKALGGVEPAQDKEYQAFVQQTDFDYTRDLDLLAGNVSKGELVLIARGHFDWQKLRSYAEAHGGTCSGDLCQTPGSTPGRWACFRQIQKNAVALAAGANAQALKQLRPVDGEELDMPSSEPVWIRFLPQSLVQNQRLAASLPAPLRAFAISLAQAQSALLSLGAADTNSGAALCIRMDAAFKNQSIAQAAGKQLQLDTNMLKLTLLRGRETLAADDLSSVLTAGTFETRGTRVYGTWPVSEEVLKAIE
jgi:hypothetical protein